MPRGVAVLFSGIQFHSLWSVIAPDSCVTLVFIPQPNDCVHLCLLPLAATAHRGPFVSHPLWFICKNSPFVLLIHNIRLFSTSIPMTRISFTIFNMRLYSHQQSFLSELRNRNRFKTNLSLVSIFVVFS